MMFHQLISRSQRTKGSMVKKILQVSLILAIVVWLLYQINHSHDTRTVYAGTRHNKHINWDADVYLGRKGRAASDNEISTGTHEGGFDESIGAKEAGEGHADGFDWKTEENSEEEASNKEHEESHEDITYSINIENQQLKQDNEDDKSDTHTNAGDEAAGEGMSEGKESDNPVDQNQNRNGVDDSAEQNELPEDNGIVQNFKTDGTKRGDVEATDSEEETTGTKIFENAMQGSEPGETVGELGDNVIAGTADSSTSLPEDQSNMEMSTKDDVDPAAEITVNNTVDEDATADARSGDESLPSEQNSAASTDSETLERDTVELQRNDTNETETTENNTMENANTSNTRSEDELGNASISTEGNDVGMQASREAPETEAFESQVENVSEFKITGNSTSEEESTDTGSGEEQKHMLTNSEGSKKEESETQEENTSDADITANDAPEEERRDPNSTEELADLSLSNKVDDIAMPVNTEDAVAENAANNSAAEAKDEASEDEVANSSLSDEQRDAGIPMGKTLDGESVKSQGDDASEAKITGNDDAFKDANTDLNFKNESSSESGNNAAQTTGNGAEEAGSEGGADSESSSSIMDSQQEELTDPVASQ